jgi:hypothetical protein
MRDSGPRSDPFQPMSRWAVRGYLALLGASSIAIVLSVQHFGWDLLSPAPSRDRVDWCFFGMFLGVFGMCHVGAALFRHVASLGREIERLKEQSPHKGLSE